MRLERTLDELLRKRGSAGLAAWFAVTWPLVSGTLVPPR